MKMLLPVAIIRNFLFLIASLSFTTLSLISHPLDVTDTTITLNSEILDTKIKIPMGTVIKTFKGGAESGMSISQKRTEILSYVLERVHFLQGNSRLNPTTSSLQFLRARGQSKPYMEVRFSVPAKENLPLLVQNTLFFENTPLQKNLITIYGKGKIDRVISTFSEYRFPLYDDPVSGGGASPAAPVTSSPKELVKTANRHRDQSTNSKSAPLTPFISLGIHHILIGSDHIAFLLGILLIVRNLKNLIWVVTSFTLAHSITLLLAALGLLSLPAGITESLIALTIVWIGVENLFFPHPGGRWRITFLLGLIHGVGFAYTFEATGIAGWDLILATVSFNLGVEIGQMLILVLVYPLLLLISKSTRLDHGTVRYGSWFLILLGTYWFLQRTGIL